LLAGLYRLAKLLLIITLIFIKMKKYTLLMAMTAILSLFMVSCTQDDDVSKPVVQLDELGANDSRTAYAGADLHIEADIVAEGKIASVRLLIHQEDEGEDELEAANAELPVGLRDAEAWVLDSTYTGVYANVKNTEFHEHVEVPSTAPTGIYHLHLYVTDLEGNQTIVEEEFEVLAPVADNNYPVISVSSAPTYNQVFTSGEVIILSGSITDVQGLAGVYIGLVKTTDGLEDSQVTAANTITLLHTHEFEDPTDYSFTASLTVGASMDNNSTPKSIDWASGSYYLVVKAPGVDGEVSFSAHYPITIQVN
jgi:hypothetical protein